jgi:simple sugar transport system substrate-binding protein
MGGKGEYAVYVGSLTVPLHNAWADAAIAYLKAKYPDMKPIGERYGVAENVDDSRKTALDLMSAHPDLKGFLAFGSQGPIGAGRAIEEKGLVGKVFVVGPFSPGRDASSSRRAPSWAGSCGIRPKRAACSSASARCWPTAKRSRTA